ncbi:hypothetical protein LCGC14_0246340 [marine sediment metagenome]|uniref:Uncharacterized protein n=1 Tax=marine sediment metagenome TaxID=412755 RepID=A0A0F9XAR1_9ZZZZ
MDKTIKIMNDIKEFLLGVLSNYKSRYNAQVEAREDKIDVTLFVGLKPQAYFLPSMVITTKAARAEKRVLTYAEIWVDHTCIFRVSGPSGESDDVAINRLLIEVLLIGLSNAHILSEDLKANQE